VKNDHPSKKFVPSCDSVSFHGEGGSGVDEGACEVGACEVGVGFEVFLDVVFVEPVPNEVVGKLELLCPPLPWSKLVDLVLQYTTRFGITAWVSLTDTGLPNAKRRSLAKLLEWRTASL